jgi:hypothetical protein
MTARDNYPMLAKVAERWSTPEYGTELSAALDEIDRLRDRTTKLDTLAAASADAQIWRSIAARLAGNLENVLDEGDHLSGADLDEARAALDARLALINKLDQ